MPDIRGRYYSRNKARYSKKDGWRSIDAPEGFLYGGAGKLVKLDEKDLPEWYVEVYVWKRFAWLDAKHVKYLVYSPDYKTNHLYKDDLLYVSYNKPIVGDETEGRVSVWYKDYDYILSASPIVSFAKAAKRYAPQVPGIDDIIDEMGRKPERFKANYPKEYRRTNGFYGQGNVDVGRGGQWISSEDD